MIQKDAFRRANVRVSTTYTVDPVEGAGRGCAKSLLRADPEAASTPEEDAAEQACFFEAISDADLANVEHYASIHPEWVNAQCVDGSHKGQVPLTVVGSAPGRQKVDLVELLLKMGANATTCNQWGTPPLACAVIWEHSDSIIPKLLTAGASSNAPVSRSHVITCNKAKGWQVDEGQTYTVLSWARAIGSDRSDVVRLLEQHQK